jgi:hypothetical protein
MLSVRQDVLKPTGEDARERHGRGCPCLYSHRRQNYGFSSPSCQPECGDAACFR